jgi:serine protein kinase
VPEASKEAFRNGIYVHKVGAMEKGEEFKFETYKPLADAIEKKLMGDLKNVVNLSIATSTNTNPRKQASRTRAFKELLKKGYCEHCANMLLAFVGEILRKT